MILPLESIRIGELKPNCAMLPAIWAICASEWRLGFLGYGVISTSFQCSIRCAIACESILHLERSKWRSLSESALCAGLSNRASGSFIQDFNDFVNRSYNTIDQLRFIQPWGTG